MQRKRIADIETFNEGSNCVFRVVFNLAGQSGIGYKVTRKLRTEKLYW